MFERNRVDNVPEPSAVPVELTLVDGEGEKGKLLVPAGKLAAEVLNGAAMFVEFEPYGGERRFIAKAQLASVRLVGVPRTQTLGRRSAQDGFDPYDILGVSPGTSWDEVRQAYVRLSKAYHPDRYSTAVLPDDVKDYLETMARRINAAYTALEAPQKVIRRAAAARSEPIFTSGPRA